jgi:hypothetical protein
MHLDTDKFGCLVYLINHVFKDFPLFNQNPKKPEVVTMVFLGPKFIILID